MRARRESFEGCDKAGTGDREHQGEAARADATEANCRGPSETAMTSYDGPAPDQGYTPGECREFRVRAALWERRRSHDADGLLDDLKEALAERVLNAEMDHHLAANEAGNSRKTVTTETGRIALETPRVRQATFDPQLIAKYQRRFPSFDDKIVSMYARGVSAREIVGHLHELYGIEVSPDLISTVTDALLDEIAAWQARPLEPVYPLVFFDALRVKVREEGLVRSIMRLLGLPLPIPDHPLSRRGRGLAPMRQHVNRREIVAPIPCDTRHFPCQSASEPHADLHAADLGAHQPHRHLRLESPGPARSGSLPASA